MTTYGSIPGVQVDVNGVSITGVIVGREQKLVIFGRADPSGTATVGEPTQVVSRSDARNKFGDGSELTEAVLNALGNGANREYLYAVPVSQTAVTAESVTGGSATLNNAPIVEDLGEVSVQNTTDGNPADNVEFRYDSAPTAPSNSNEVHINPQTGEVEAGDSDDYEVDYKYLEYSTAFDAADNVLNEFETGIYAVLSEAESVASELVTKVTTLRGQYKMVRGVAGAQPNANSSETPPDARFDTGSYSDALDNDATFVHAPARREDSSRLLTGGVAGLFAGNDLTNPVYRDSLNGYTGVEQKLTKAEANDLRDKGVIPIRDEGSIVVADNTSTSTSTSWERDFFTRRIVDQVILIAKQVGDSILGRRNTEQTRTIAEEEIKGQIEGFVNDGLLQDNTDDERNFFVDFYEDPNDTNTVLADLGISPVGVVKTVELTIEVET
jgi:hypothetical protein